MSRRNRVETQRHPEFSRDSGKPALFGKPTWMAFGLLILVGAVALTIPTIPQYRKLKEVRAELKEAQEQEAQLLGKVEQLAAEAEALKTNPRYLEARARDPLRVHLPGETVIQMEN